MVDLLFNPYAWTWHPQPPCPPSSPQPALSSCSCPELPEMPPLPHHSSWPKGGSHIHRPNSLFYYLLQCRIDHRRAPLTTRSRNGNGDWILHWRRNILVLLVFISIGQFRKSLFLRHQTLHIRGSLFTSTPLLFHPIQPGLKEFEVVIDPNNLLSLLLLLVLQEVDLLPLTVTPFVELH